MNALAFKSIAIYVLFPIETLTIVATALAGQWAIGLEVSYFFMTLMALNNSSSQMLHAGLLRGATSFQDDDWMFINLFVSMAILFTPPCLFKVTE